MNITPHFTLEEMSVTQIRGIDNTPPQDLVRRLMAVCNTLEVVRWLLGNAPMLITSGYRCPEINDRVGGAKDSAHLQGWAADFVCPAFGPPLKIAYAIADSAIKFDQLINEGAKGTSLGWVHISVDPRLRRQVLTADFNSGSAVYTAGLTEVPAPVTTGANQG
jgi:zinc D-Ala-D-Ala carboxypeptidase